MGPLVYQNLALALVAPGSKPLVDESQLLGRQAVLRFAAVRILVAVTQAAGEPDLAVGRKLRYPLRGLVPVVAAATTPASAARDPALGAMHLVAVLALALAVVGAFAQTGPAKGSVERLFGNPCGLANLAVQQELAECAGSGDLPIELAVEGVLFLARLVYASLAANAGQFW